MADATQTTSDRLPLPPDAPASMVYFDRVTESGELRAYIEQAKANMWSRANVKRY